MACVGILHLYHVADGRFVGRSSLVLNLPSTLRFFLARE